MNTTMLRAKVRENVNLDREKQRTSFADSCRVGLGEIEKQYEDVLICSPEQVKQIAVSLKHKNKASEKEMRKLSYAFIQSADNIKAFMEVPFSLNPLINELSYGSHTIATLECFYNLTLGDKHICDRIIKAAGFYIVTFAHNGDSDIKRISLWILANLLSEKCNNVKRLLDAHLLEVLWNDYNAQEETAENYCMDAAICLYLAVKIAQKERLSFIRRNFTLKSPTSLGAEYHLCILHHANMLEQNLMEDEKLYLLNFALFNLSRIDIDTFAGKLRVLYGVRMLGNMLNLYRSQANFLETILNQMHVLEMNICDTLNQLFACRNDHLSNETLWLTKNWIEVLIINNKPTESFIESLRIPK